jgi:hypothetical protein
MEQQLDQTVNFFFLNNNNDDGKHRLAICLHLVSIYFIELHSPLYLPGGNGYIEGGMAMGEKWLYDTGSNQKL